MLCQPPRSAQQEERNIRQRRLEGGSRFNVRFRDAVPASALTPHGLEAALAEYVIFPERPVNPFRYSMTSE
jgi:hypothetical protein